MNEITKRPSTNALKFQSQATEMSRLMRGSSISTIKAGRIMMTVNKGFNREENAFRAWIEHNFQLSLRTAYRWMEKTKKFEGIGMSQLENMHPTVLGTILAHNCPDDVTRDVLIEHSRQPITDPSSIRHIMQEADTQHQITEGKQNDGKSAAKNIINYINRIDTSKYTEQERIDMKAALEAKFK